MKTSLRVALAGTLAAGSLAAGSLVLGGAASAAPRLDPGLWTQSGLASGVEQARIVCDAWGRCWRTRPRYYRPYYGWGGPRYYGYGWGGPRHYYGWGGGWGPGWRAWP